mgnify:CR=1 FL=1
MVADDEMAGDLLEPRKKRSAFLRPVVRELDKAPNV